jgi:hypothetical protein
VLFARSIGESQPRTGATTKRESRAISLRWHAYRGRHEKFKERARAAKRD